MKRFRLILHRPDQLELSGAQLKDGSCILAGVARFMSMAALLRLVCTRPGEHAQWLEKGETYD